jgi:hypothetical protein
VKRFIFGRRKDDPKGPANEHGEVEVDAPSLAEARKAFTEKHGDKDARADIVRVVGVEASKPKRKR